MQQRQYLEKVETFTREMFWHLVFNWVYSVRLWYTHPTEKFVVLEYSHVVWE